jgi:hypothetical protein
MRRVRTQSDLVHDAAFCEGGGVSFFLREEWDALFTRIASHSWERMDTGTDLMTLGHLGRGHGKEAGHYLDGAYPGVYLIPRKTARYFSFYCM